MKYFIKIILVMLLLGCLLKMPYGYYQYVRLITCFGFAWLTYTEYIKKRNYLAVICTLVAVLFNPVFKVHFERGIWNAIDIAIAVALIIWVVIDLLSLFYIKRYKNSCNPSGSIQKGHYPW